MLSPRDTSLSLAACGELCVCSELRSDLVHRESSVTGLDPVWTWTTTQSLTQGSQSAAVTEHTARRVSHSEDYSD
uniref:Uncharacterized protein n=1 Tax=Knipowitschia caucasica TaxID=637954 RepID=A0AAV2KF81_KNICA